MPKHPVGYRVTVARVFIGRNVRNKERLRSHKFFRLGADYPAFRFRSFGFAPSHFFNGIQQPHVATLAIIWPQ